MTARIVKFKEKADEPVGVIAVFENACSVDTLEYPLVTLMSSDDKFTVKMVVPSDCYLAIEYDA